MVIVEKCRHGERGDDCAAAQRVLVIGKGGTHAFEETEPRGNDHRGNAGNEQGEDQSLLFCSKQCDQVNCCNCERDHAGP